MFCFFSRDPKCLSLDNINGFILNIPTEYKFGFLSLPLKKRHWITLKKLNGFFYNLDSKFDTPYLIGNDDDFIIYLNDQINCKDKELFIVVSRDISLNQNWLKNIDDIEMKKNHIEEKSSDKNNDKFIVNELKDDNREKKFNLDNSSSR